MPYSPKHWIVLYLLLFITGAEAAQVSPQGEVELRILLLELKEDQKLLARRISEVEVALERQSGNQELVDTVNEKNVGRDAMQPESGQPTSSPSLKSEGHGAEDNLRMSGDLQLRYESNFNDADGSGRNRGVLRGRLRADYDINHVLTIGAELSTGAADDPNTAHVTLSNFVDDFDINFSRLYARAEIGAVTVVGGKFANPLAGHGLVWDGDVNPQGASVSYQYKANEALSVNMTGLYFIVDEQAAGADSDMLGGEVAVSLRPARDWRFDGAVAYHDYRLNSLANAGAGDFRSNLRDGTGGYLSDFDMLSVQGAVIYAGLDEQWPIRITGGFVQNFGAAVPDDKAYTAGASLGRAVVPGDWRFAYDYSQAEVDSVLGAFSHDNLPFATNYKLHAFAVNYVLLDQLALSASLFHYRPLDAVYAAPNSAADWLDRLRLNATVSF